MIRSAFDRFSWIETKKLGYNVQLAPYTELAPIKVDEKSQKNEFFKGIFLKCYFSPKMAPFLFQETSVHDMLIFWDFWT